jgi:hypothetical protein
MNTWLHFNTPLVTILCNVLSDSPILFIYIYIYMIVISLLIYHHIRHFNTTMIELSSLSTNGVHEKEWKRRHQLPTDILSPRWLKFYNFKEKFYL